MAGESAYSLLVISDLHLSEGRSPATKKFSRNEDFFFDEEFARFLKYYSESREGQGREWHLIINGDFVDFLQVTSYEDAPPSLNRDPRHPEYGLGCGAKESVYKLEKIVEGHRRFFAALAEFVASGNLLTIGKGNHDVEFHYTEVRESLRQQLQAVYRKRLESDAVPRQDIAARVARVNAESVRFIDWFYLEKGLIYIEHGNQYDRLNSFKYFLEPLLPQGAGVDSRRENEIDLPWGSLFVRYLFNRVEKAEPYADNIKPSTRFISWYIRKHPIKALWFLFGDGRYMLAKMRRAWRPVPPQAYALREAQHRGRLCGLAAEAGIPEADLDYLDSLRGRSVLKEPSARWKLYRWVIRRQLLLPGIFLLLFLMVFGALLAFAPLLTPLMPAAVRWLLWDSWITSPGGRVVWEAVSIVRWLLVPVVVVGAVVWFLNWLLADKGEKGPSTLARQAHRIRERLRVRYVIMGHTHDADLQSIGSNGEEYFNTGTWTKVFVEGEERLVREENELVFAECRRKGSTDMRVKLLKWDDQRGAPRLVKLFDPPASWRKKAVS